MMLRLFSMLGDDDILPDTCQTRRMFGEDKMAAKIIHLVQTIELRR